MLSCQLRVLAWRWCTPVAQHMHVRESLEVLHPVQGGTQGHLQDHGIVRHAALGVVVHIVLAPLPYHPEALHIVGECSRHERVEPHGEGAAVSVALWPAIDIADVGVGAQGDFLVQARQRHVVEEARGARDAREVGDIVEVLEDELDQVQRQLLALSVVGVTARGRGEPGVNRSGDGGSARVL